MLKRKTILALLSTVFLTTVSGGFADSSTALMPQKDAGIINKERIIYWLTKRGDLATDASVEEKEAAFRAYASRANGHYEVPRHLVKLEQAAAKRKLVKHRKSGANANTRVKVLSVLVDFPDLPYNNNRLSSRDTAMYYDNYSVEHFQNLQFATNGYAGPNGQTLQTGYQFYQEESGGSFFFTGNTFGWVTADNNAAFYGANVGQNDNDQAAPDLIKEAVAKAVAANNIDLNEYDIEDPFDSDGDGNLNEPDGFIDHVMVYHSSVGEEAGGGVLGDNAIWSHRFFVNANGGSSAMGYGIPNTSKRLFGYTIQPIDAAIGVVVHEFGHDLGLPDEYDIGNSAKGSPVGHWSVMAGGSWAGNIRGTQPTGFSAYARDFFQKKFGGNWIEQTTLKLDDLENGSQRFQLVEAVNHDSSNVNQIRIDLPLPDFPFFEPYMGEHQFYSGEGNELSNKLTFEVQLPDANAISLSMKAHWDIENDWDFVLIKANGENLAGNHTIPVNQYTDRYPLYDDVTNYLTGKSASISNAEGDAKWIDLTFDLTAYRGETVTLELVYITDGNTGGYGFAADDIQVTAGESAIFSDGAEAENTMTYNGFERIEGSTKGAAQNYWIQLRSHKGRGSGLASRNYNQGVVVWLGNKAYSDNRVGDHPGYGFVGVVDANQSLIGNQSSSTQVRDAAFTLGENPIFRDSEDYSQPLQPESGLILPINGFELEILSQDNDFGRVEVELRKTTVGLVAAFSSSKSVNTITFTNRSMGEGLLSYLWDFGDGSSSTLEAPTHTYNEAGSFTVNLTISDESGNVDEMTRTIVIKTVQSSDSGGSLSVWTLLVLIFVGIRRRS